MMDEAWVVANRLAGTNGIFDNVVMSQREIWRCGELMLSREQKTCDAMYNTWGFYPDHPLNKAE